MEPITREERLMNAAAGGEASGITPITREEQFLAYAAGESDTKPKPITRKEMFLDKMGGGGAATPLQEKTITITENGTTEVLPDEGYALSKVTATAQVYDGGVDPRFSQLFNRTITEVSDDALSIPAHVLHGCTKLTRIDFPNATEVGESAFHECFMLVDVNIPNATKLGRCAFEGFASYPSPWVQLSFPLVTDVGDYCFRYRNGAETINLPKVQKVGSNAFNGCNDLKYITLPELISAGSNAFQSCKKLQYGDFTKLPAIGQSMFYSCEKFNTLILRKADTICTGISSSGFYKTAFASNGTGGICLVPRALIETYQTATNWSALYAAGTCLFWALEDYTVDGTTTGEINWDKLNADREGAFA